MIIKVEAMIREEKLEDVLDALAALDVHGITCYQVMGCGTQRFQGIHLRSWTPAGRDSNAPENQDRSSGFF